MEHVKRSAFGVLSDLGKAFAGRLPEEKITPEQRNSCLALVKISEASRSSDELMFLSGAFEDAARRKKREQEQRGGG